MSPEGNQRLLVVSFSAVPSDNRQGVEVEWLISTLASRLEMDMLTIRTAAMGYVERYRRTRMLRVPVGAGNPRAEQVDAFRRAVRRQLEGAEYDVIHFRSAYGGLPLCQLKKQLDARLIFDLALTSEREQRWLAPGPLQQLRDEENYCLERADLIITRSRSSAKALEARGHGRPVVVVPPGVNVDRFDWEPHPPREFPRIACVGSLGPGRDLDVLLEAFRRLRATAPAELLLIGPIQPGYGRVLREQIEQAGLSQDVRLTGEVPHDDIPQLLSGAEVCVVPWLPTDSSAWTGPPLKVLEYLACRRAVLAPDRPAIRALLGHRPPVKLFTPGAPGELAAALGRLIADPQLRSQLATEGYRLVRERFTAAAVRRSILAAYGALDPTGSWLWGEAERREEAPSGSVTSPTGRRSLHSADPAMAHDSGIDDVWMVRSPSPPATVPDDAEEPTFEAASELLGSRGSAPSGHKPAAQRDEDSDPE